VVLEANPSFLARLARHAAARGLAIRQPRLIVLTYENPSRLHVRSIRRAFDAPVASSYGSTEAGYVLMECEHGRLHQITDSCHVDFLPLCGKHGGPSIGRILVTTLANPWRSLIRFDPGDLVRLEERGPCPCGRGEGLTFRSVEGRVVNLTLSDDGRLVTPAEVDRALSEVADLVEYQVVQHAPARHELRYVAEPGRDAAVRREAVEALARLYGNSSIEARRVGAVRPDPPGKYRLARALFPIDIDACVDPRYRPRPEDQG
jgi:phenylacetate-CoA ligase